MDIQDRHLNSRTIIAFAMTVALAFPCVVDAVSIGEIVLQSKLGEPLLAQVDLVVGSDEDIEDSCLTLATPDPSEEDTNGFLTKAKLSLKTEGKRQYVSISSRNPFNEAFGKLRLQVKCPSTGSVIKTLIILPDLDTSIPQTPITAPSLPAGADNTSPTDAHPVSPAANQGDARSTPPAVNKHIADKTTRRANNRHAPSAQTSGRNHGSSATFRLKLSGDPIDESRIGKISTDERALLLARQKMLDADDQTANFLAMQHQVKLLQSELGEIKLQLAQLGISPSAAASSAPATDTQENRPKPAFALKQLRPQQYNPYLQNGLIVALGLVLTVFALWLGLSYYTKRKSRTAIESKQDTTPILKVPSDVDTSPRMPTSAVAKKTSQTPDSQINSDPVQTAVAPTKASTIRKETVSSHTPAPQKAEEEGSEEDSMLEEAGLYASHGRPAKAVEILQEIIKRRPSKEEAWPLLLSIYSSLAKATEFEKTAREFLKHHKDSASWNGIKALGRTFDQNNPLYADNNSRISASPLLPDAANPRRPVGDVLIEMGVLSKQDLQHCLDDFDPKKHGRFGGYLVARKVITLAQLDQALLQQQGVVNEVKAGALPSLQDMENFLADFDPKRDGSVGEFLASRNAVTPEQLSHLLQPHSSKTEAVQTPQTDNPPSLDAVSSGDFVLESGAKLPVPDLEFKPESDKHKPLNFEVEPPSSPLQK